MINQAGIFLLLEMTTNICTPPLGWMLVHLGFRLSVENKLVLHFCAAQLAKKNTPHFVKDQN